MKNKKTIDYIDKQGQLLKNVKIPNTLLIILVKVDQQYILK